MVITEIPVEDNNKHLLLEMFKGYLNLGVLVHIPPSVFSSSLASKEQLFIPVLFAYSIYRGIK